MEDGGAGARAEAISSARCGEGCDPVQALVETGPRAVGAVVVGTVAVGAVGVKRALSASVSVCFVGAAEVAAGVVLVVLEADRKYRR